MTSLPRSARLLSGVIAVIFFLLSVFMWVQLAHVGVFSVGRGLGGLLLGIIVPAAFGLLFLSLAFTGTTERLTP